MRILQFIDTPRFAGTERHVLDLTRGLRSHGAEVSIVCPRLSPLVMHAKEAGLSAMPFGNGRTLYQAGLRSLISLLANENVDIIHAHNGRTALLSVIAIAMAKRGRCVFTQHFLEPRHVNRKGPGGGISCWAHQWVNRRINGFIAISGSTVEQMILRGDAIPGRIELVENGIAEPDVAELMPQVELRTKLGISLETSLIVCLSRLEREKDVSSLVSAMARVNHVQPGTICLIAGDGSLRKSLRDQARQLGLDREVQFLGHRNDVHSVVHASDLFVLPSGVESFGLSIVEAMSLSKPVIATNAGGPKEIVIHGETGLLVPPSNPDALASAILDLISDPERARRMGEAGRQRFLERYTAERMAKETIEVYRKVLEYPNQRAAHSSERAVARRT